MGRYIDGQNRTQIVLFPERLEDWIDEDNPVRSVGESSLRQAAEMGPVRFVGLSNQGAMYRVLNHSMTHISLWKH